MAVTTNMEICGRPAHKVITINGQHTIVELVRGLREWFLRRDQASSGLQMRSNQATGGNGGRGCVRASRNGASCS
jgi:hypothetical protein